MAIWQDGRRSLAWVREGMPLRGYAAGWTLQVVGAAHKTVQGEFAGSLRNKIAQQGSAVSARVGQRAH